MNKRGGFQVGIVLVLVLFLMLLITFSTIEPMKENLDANRGATGSNTGLNCPGTVTHDATDYANDTNFEKLVRRPTCFITGISMVWFVSVVIFVYGAWALTNWRKP